jgi:hypothetical protein
LVDIEAWYRRLVPKGEPQEFPLYVAEFAFRYNKRANADIFRTAIKEC